MGWHIETSEDAGRWVANKIHGCCPYGACGIGLRQRGNFVAGVMYEQFNGRSIVAHIAVEGRMTPAFLVAVFDYPFNVCDVNKVICPIPSENARSIALATNMGFHEEARILDAQPNGDILIYTLAKSDCRFLGEQYLGKIRTHPACRA